MYVRHAMTLFAVLVLNACVHSSAAPRPSQSAKEATEMTASPDPRATAPTLDAEQALTRLLTLIRETRSVEEFSPQRLAAAFGVPVSVFEPGYWGYGEQFSPDWSYSIEMREKIKIGPRFSFGFNSGPGAPPPIDALCGLDYARFTAGLEAMGFDRKPYRGEYGRFINDWFERPGMRVAVYPIGEPTPADGTSSRICVKRVLIP